jgi:hypothetical protein
MCKALALILSTGGKKRQLCENFVKNTTPRVRLAIIVIKLKEVTKQPRHGK